MDVLDVLKQRMARDNSSTGELTISLIWDDRNDLDIHVLAPSNQRIHGGNKKSDCGGVLESEANVKGESKEPLEHVVWKKAPEGKYTVHVHFYKRHKRLFEKNKGPSNYYVIVQANGTSQVFSGSIEVGPVDDVCVFEMPSFPLGVTTPGKATFWEKN